MKLITKRFDTSIPLPEYEEKAAGFDFVCREDAIIDPKEIKALPGNIALEIPEGYVLLVVPRSSTANRKGMIMPHSMGVVDPFYDGEDNEIVLLFQNITDQPVKVKRGEKLAQGILVKYEKVEFDESKKLKPSKREKWNVSNDDIN